MPQSGNWRYAIVPLLAAVWLQPRPLAAEAPPIFPPPQSLRLSNDAFAIDDRTRIVLPANASDQDLLLSRALQDDLSDRFAAHPKTERASSPAARAGTILMGSIANPLVKAYCVKNGID